MVVAIVLYTYLRAYCLSHLGHLKGFSPVSAMLAMDQDPNPEIALRDRWWRLRCSTFAKLRSQNKHLRHFSGVPSIPRNEDCCCRDESMLVRSVAKGLGAMRGNPQKLLTGR